MFLNVVPPVISRTGLLVCPWATLLPEDHSHGEQNPVASGATWEWMFLCHCCMSLCVYVSLSLLSLCLSLCFCPAFSFSVSGYVSPCVCVCVCWDKCALCFGGWFLSCQPAFGESLSVSLPGCVAGCQSCSLQFQSGFVKVSVKWGAALDLQGWKSPPNPEQPVF